MAKRKASRKTLVKKVDKIFSKYIRLRDKYCVLCGSPENGNCGHLFSRRHYSTRWDDGNCFQQCYPCNFKHNLQPSHYYNWYIEKFGKEKLDELHSKHQQTKKYTNVDLEELYEEIKERYEELEKIS